MTSNKTIQPDSTLLDGCYSGTICVGTATALTGLAAGTRKTVSPLLFLQFYLFFYFKSKKAYKKIECRSSWNQLMNEISVSEGRVETLLC